MAPGSCFAQSGAGRDGGKISNHKFAPGTPDDRHVRTHMNVIANLGLCRDVAVAINGHMVTYRYQVRSSNLYADSKVHDFASPPHDGFAFSSWVHYSLHSQKSNTR